MKSQDQLKTLIQDSVQGLTESRRQLEALSDSASPDEIQAILQVAPRSLIAQTCFFPWFILDLSNKRVRLVVDTHLKRRSLSASPTRSTCAPPADCYFDDFGI